MIILFGSTGSLSKKKLIPALNQLHEKGILNEPIVCVSRRDITKKQYLELIKFKGSKSFAKKIHYYKMDLTKPDNQFKEYINKLFKKHNCKGKIFYLAIPDYLFNPAINIIKKLKGRGYERVIFEKPFGHDLKSAKQINKIVLKAFPERDIYRIDHYLAKEMIQNIIVFRFMNSLFKLDKEHVSSIQVILDEEKGIGDRGISYYDKAGAIKDMVQNHVMQLISLITMKKPKRMNYDNIIKEKVKIIKSLEPKQVIIGQYEGYVNEKGVSKNSTTETFTAIKAFINNDSWKGVPVYIRTGKELAKEFKQVNIILKPNNNVISIKFMPKQEIIINFKVKKPGPDLEPVPATLRFSHQLMFKENSPKAYELIIQDIINGEKDLCTSWEEVKASWVFTEKVITLKKKLIKYEKKSNGPVKALKMTDWWYK